MYNNYKFQTISSYFPKAIIVWEIFNDYFNEVKN